MPSRVSGVPVGLNAAIFPNFSRTSFWLLFRVLFLVVVVLVLFAFFISQFHLFKNVSKLSFLFFTQVFKFRNEGIGKRRRGEKDTPQWMDRNSLTNIPALALPKSVLSRDLAEKCVLLSQTPILQLQNSKCLPTVKQICLDLHHVDFD